MPSKLSSPFLAFACVGEVDDDIDFAVGTGSEGGGSVVSVESQGPPGRERAPGKDD